MGDQVSLLTDQTAVITGGAQGLGYAIAERFIAEGARVVLGDLDQGATEAAAKQLGGDDVALAVRCDVTRADEVEALVTAAVQRFGGLDVMVNNAGITRDATLRKMTEEQFDQVIAVHLKGTWNGIKSAAAIMRENQRGAIVNMSSISGKVGLIGQTNYSAAKAGIVGMTKAAAKELAHLGVRVNAIQPGLIRSAMTEAMPQHIWDQKLAAVPMGRAGDPAEVAKVALFLASYLSSYMTGTVLEVSRGHCFPNCVAPASGRVVALDAGLPVSVPGMQVDRRCGSGLQAVIQACLQVSSGENGLLGAGGAESMTNVAFYSLDMRWGG